MTRKNKRILIISASALAGVLLTVIVAGSFYLLHFALSSERPSAEQVLDDLEAHSPAFVMPWLDRIEPQLRDTTVEINGYRAHAIYLAADSLTPHTALLLHGYHTCARAMMHIAYMYHENFGYNVLIPDLYGHGESEGDHVNMGWDDRNDAMMWAVVAHNRFSTPKAEASIVVHGISMGATTAMCLAGEPCPEYVKAIVEDCGYTSAWDEFSHQMKEMFSLPAFPMLYTGSSLCWLKYGWTFGQASAEKQLKKSKLPILFIHGDHDNFVPFEMMQRLVAAHDGPHETLVAKGSEHAMAYHDHPDLYTDTVRHFLNTYID